ncbi:MAG: hypothetical protein IT168_33390 [Bryobacterales bacterium]|nr:hypothetical protein [Bryobacterales bacterium]
MTTSDQQLEQYVRVQIVFRALVSDNPALAGLFAESRFTVDTRAIRLQWDVTRMGRCDDRASLGRSLDIAMARIGLPYRVLVEVTHG